MTIHTQFQESFCYVPVSEWTQWCRSTPRHWHEANTAVQWMGSSAAPPGCRRSSPVSWCPTSDWSLHTTHTLITIQATSIKQSLSRLQQILNFLACTVVKAPKSCHITPILRSVHWLRIQPPLTYLQRSHNYPTFITSSPLNVLAVLALHPSLLLLSHLHHPL